MPDKDDADWAGKGFTKRNEESAPEPKAKPKLRVVPKTGQRQDAIHPWNNDDEDWIWE